MNFKKFTVLSISAFLISSCGGSDKKTSSTENELSGIWQSENNNTLYSLDQNANNVTINVCDEDSPFTLMKEGDVIKGDTNFFNVNSLTELEFSEGPLAGVKLNKVSDSTNFNSGSLSLSSSNIENIDISSDVCAYRESDNVNNSIGAPYLDGYLLITIGVENEEVGEFTIPSNVSLYVESDQFPAAELNASSGIVNVTSYTTEKFEAIFTFTTADGNEYTGSVKVDI